MPRKRSRLEIVLDILDALAGGPENPTRLATRVNLPYDRLAAILRSLESKGIVRVEEASRSQRSRQVILTKKGWELLDTLRSLKRVLRDFDLEDIL